MAFRGTVAGAIKMNAGSFGVAVSDHLPVRYLPRQDGQAGDARKIGVTLWVPHIFICAVGTAFWALHSSWQFGEKVEIRKVMEQVWGERREKHPMELPSAGSIFKNTGGKPAWRYIDEVGLSRYRIGNAAYRRNTPTSS